MKLSKKEILKSASDAYNKNIKPLINLEDIDINKIVLIVKKLCYQITGNEDILCVQKQDEELKRLMDNFYDVFQKMNDETGYGLIELMNEIEDSNIENNYLSEDDKKHFAEVLKKPSTKLKMINMVLASIFVAICFKSAGYKIKF